MNLLCLVKKSESKAEEEKDSDDDLLTSEEPLIFFKKPQQLLDIFAELEENNLALIQNCQETEENLEELKAKIAETTTKMYICRINAVLIIILGKMKPLV